MNTEKKLIKTETWKWFKISDIFKKIKIKKYSFIPEIKGNVPFISSTELNNGVVKFVNETSIPGNCITVSTNGSCFKSFYHFSKISVSSDVEVLYSDFLNEKNAMFLITVLNLETKKYSYNNKPKNDKVWNTKIKLPFITDSYGNTSPDWNFMNKYIETLEQKEVQKLIDIMLQC